MKENHIKDVEIGHIFQENSAHLNSQLAKLLCDRLPHSRIYIREFLTGPVHEQFTRDNSEWIGKLPAGSYGGGLISTRWHGHRWFRGYVWALATLFLPELGLRSWWRIVKGPKYWVMHGYWLSFPTILLMRLLGKRVILHHWGGPVTAEGRLSKPFIRWDYRCYAKIFVTMQPEEKYFSKIVGSDGVMTVPYPGFFNLQESSGYFQSVQRRILIGNSTWCRTAYKEILNKVVPEEWEKVVCMLPYGREDDCAGTDAFVGENTRKFGERFYAWRKVLPLNEYNRLVNECPFYFCPAKSQTGLGIIYLSVAQGKAIFVRGDNYEWLTYLGIQAVNIDELHDYSYCNLLKFIPEKDVVTENVRKLTEFFEEHDEKFWICSMAHAFGLGG